MKTSYLDLEQILNIPKWQHLQDSLAASTHLAIITVDYKGIPLTKHSAPRPFCEYVRSQPDLEKFCHKCDSRGGLEAARLNAPYIYLCHCNIVDIAIPIMIDGKYIGATMAGQIRLADHRIDDLEQILISPNKPWLNSSATASLYNELPVLSLKEVQQSAQMLYDLSSYIVEEAMNRNLLLEMYENITHNAHALRNNHLVSGYSINNIEKARKVMKSAMTNAYIHTDTEKRIQCKNPTILPALNYIYENKNETITLNQMANLCHISPSHFSRVFAKEVGEGFSHFLARQKIEWSKQFLVNTNLPISEISEELGFCDAGYFIKTFKKYEKITPAVYRKYYFSQN